ncbi:MAG TPA: hypothetical protein PLK76_01625 [bacterium]|nr:hypothetical protein [bacterium]
MNICEQKLREVLPVKKVTIIESQGIKTLLDQNVWSKIEKAAANRKNPHLQEEERPITPRLIMDKIHRQTLFMQARIEGMRNLDRFQELADYLESTVYERESKDVNVPIGLSDEQKKKVIEDWKAKGWNGEVDDFYENTDSKYAGLTLTRSVPLRLGREHVRLMKDLVSVDNNPRELAEGLRKIGFEFSDFMLKSPDEMRQLGKFFTAPHAKEALELAQDISRWGSDWFANDGSYGKTVEVGQIEFLAKLAQNPDPKTVFPLEVIKRVNTLAAALNMRVGVAEIGQLQTIMNNPDYLEFVAYLNNLGGSDSSYRERIPVFENIIALDQAGLLKPVVELYRSGVSLESTDRYYYLFSHPSLRKLFDSYEATSKPQEVRREVVQYLQEILAQPKVKAFLNDAPRREFVRLLGELRGYPLIVEELSSLDKMFGEGLARGEEAIVVLKCLRGSNQDGQEYNLDLNTLSAVTSDARVMEAFTNEEFPKFVEALESRAGYRPSKDDIYFQGSSILAEVFNNPTVRAGLVQDATTKVIKALGGQINLHNPEYYIRLGNNPNMVQTINALRDMGCKLFDYFSLPSAETLEAIANDPSAITKLKSPELKSLAIRLTKEFKWVASHSETSNLLALYDDKGLQQKLFNPENVDYIKKVRPHGLALSDVRSILDLDSARRDLIVKLVGQFSFSLDFSFLRSTEQQEMLDRLVQNDNLRRKLFSKQTQGVFNRLKTDFGYYRLEIRDIDTIVRAPSDFPDFIGELEKKYRYSFKSKDLMPLLQLAANKEGFNDLLDMLCNHGYQFGIEDITYISQLIPYAQKLPILFSTVNQILSSEEIYLEGSKVAEQYVFNVWDIPYLLQLEAFIDRLPAIVTTLGEVMEYKFNVRDSDQLAFIIAGGYTKEQLAGLKQIHDKYKDQDSDECNINSIRNLEFIQDNEDTIARLESYNYKFRLQHAPQLRSLLESPNKEVILQTLDILRDNFSFAYNPNISQYYVKLAQIPDIEDKLREARASIVKEDLMQENNFKLFVALRADAGLYNHARKFLSDVYFRNIRDAQNRLAQFNNRMLSEAIPEEVLVKIFSVSGKATELDRIALKYGITAEIARVAQNVDWYGPLLQTNNFQEANEAMTSMMIDLAIPVVYSGLQDEELDAKKNKLIELAGKEKEFDDILEIACRSVGVFGQKYSNKGQDFDILMGAIRQSLELNLERNPKVYAQKRAELSSHQFDRIFEGMPDDARERVMKIWLDLSPRRRLRVSGDVITVEEATLSRLNRIRDILHTDLSVHLQELFITKVKELEAAIEREETNGSRAEQFAIYKKYLMTPEGLMRKDILMMYRSVEKFIRNAQEALKNPETPKEEKGKLGKILGTYEAVSDSLKALYRLGTISEKRYEARRNYLKEIEKHIGEFSGALKRLKILDPDSRSTDVNTRALEEEVLLDFGKLKGAMAEENASGQIVFETESTVNFNDLAKAPEMTQSCQRLTEVTGLNHAAYSRLLDGSNEMIDIYEMRNGEKNRLSRSFIELSKVKLTGEDQARLAVLIDRQYVNPQYQNFTYQFSNEMMLHMLDRLSADPELSLVFDSNRFAVNSDVQEVLRARGYKLRKISEEYFVNESNVRLTKYYDSFGGLNNVAQPAWEFFDGFCIIEKI